LLARCLVGLREDALKDLLGALLRHDLVLVVPVGVGAFTPGAPGRPAGTCGADRL
jgi:hypothetical protein